MDKGNRISWNCLNISILFKTKEIEDKKKNMVPPTTFSGMSRGFYNNVST